MFMLGEMGLDLAKNEEKSANVYFVVIDQQHYILGTSQQSKQLERHNSTIHVLLNWML